MKKSVKWIVLGLLAVLLAAGAAGAGVWWMLKDQVPQTAEAKAAAEAAAQAKKEASKPAPDYKYVTLDKILVMLRGDEGSSVANYMAMDVVFKTLPDQEKRTKEHLPLLRTIAVKALSAYTVERARAMTVPEFAEALNKAYADSYASERREPPFAEALIGKLIIE